MFLSKVIIRYYLYVKADFVSFLIITQHFFLSTPSMIFYVKCNLLLIFILIHTAEKCHISRRLVKLFDVNY